MNPTHQEPPLTPACSNLKQDALSGSLDRALTAAERAHEQMLVTRRRMDFFLCICWIVMVFGLLGVLILILAAMAYFSVHPIDRPATNIAGSAAGGIVMSIPFSIIWIFAGREWKRLKASYARDSRYVGKLVDFLREAVKPDDFPSRLEWHLFQMRIARFDIGHEERSASARDAARAMEHRERLSPSAESLPWPPARPPIPSPGQTPHPTSPSP